MAKLSTDLRSGVLHPRETLFRTENLGAANAEFSVEADGASTVTLDMRGTFSLTVEVAGTVDGANWTPIPMLPVNAAGKSYLAVIAGTAGGTWIGFCAGYRRVRVRCTAYTSGTATATLATAVGNQDLLVSAAAITSGVGTTLGTAGAATTLTLAAPGAGLRHYLTYLSINRFATALLTAGTAPVNVTTTNLPGSLAFSFAADAAAQGTLDRWREDFAFPIVSSAQNTATTIVCPATTGVIWRITAGFFVAP